MIPSLQTPNAFSGTDNPTYYLFPWRYLDPHLIDDSLGPSESVPHMASQKVQLFLYRTPVCPTDKQTDRATFDKVDKLSSKL